MSSPIYLNADIPIGAPEEDLFRRSDFASKIASLCGKRTAHSTIIGIYGKWGDGKSSLLNIVSQKLDADIVQFSFNPWFFNDEEELLQGFFKTMADKLGRKLTTKTEAINNLFADYGEAVGVLEVIPKIGVVPAIVKGFTRLFKRKSRPTAEVAKNRVNEFLIESRLNLVVFIDDIDRLDVREVGAVFKLVKLIADFPRTTYILSFDPEIVAVMLSPLYGGSIPESGYRFIEKVIQLPLNIPKAHEDNIFSFLRKTINSITTENNIDIEAQNERLAEIFADGLLTLLNNPRKIIRFSNALKFSLHILNGEVNPIDLIIVEAFKASLPEYYSLLRDNKEMFLENYLDHKKHEHTSGKENADKITNAILKSYPLVTRNAIRELTKHLFPQFIWMPAADAKEDKRESLLIQKRICTPEYFERYFTFTLQPEELSDLHFSKFYLGGSAISVADLAKQIANDIESYSPDQIAFKIATHRQTLAGLGAENLVKAICLVSDKLPQKVPMEIGSPFTLLALSIDTMLSSVPPDKALSIAVDAVSSATSLDFAAELTARFVMPESPDNPKTRFGGKRAQKIKEAYLSRLKKLMEDRGFFEAIPEPMMLRQLVWWNDIDHHGLQAIIHDLLDKDPTAPLKFLRIFTPTVNSAKAGTNEIRSFKSNFTEDEYFRIENIIGASKLYNALMWNNQNQSHLSTIDTIGYNEPIDDMTLIGRFQRMYQLHSGMLTIEEDRRRD